MTEVERILERISRTPGCAVTAPSGLPVIRTGDCIPDDLLEFYSRCGGVRFYEDRLYPIRIVAPDELVRANPVLVGAECPDDISDAWYIVAWGGGEQAVTIDCSSQRLGRCYDSFCDRHGVAGDCSIVALSFTELLRRLADDQGGCWYWLGTEAPAYGDAYA